MHRRYPNDRRLCRTLALAALFCHCKPTLRANLPELQAGRITAGPQGVEHGANWVERVPINVCQVNGNLCINEVTQAGGGQAVGQAAGVAHTVGGADHGQVLQSVLLNQQCSNSVQAVLQVQMDNGFASVKQHIDRRFVTLNDNVRHFGGAIQGGFARQDPAQAGNRQAARGELPPPQPPNLPVGVVHRDPTAELAPTNLHTLEELWTEWKFGTGGRKPAQLFSRAERGGHGSKAKKIKFCCRLKIYLLLQKLVDEGGTTAQAIAAVKLHCGAAKSVTQFSEAMRLIPNHPSLHPLPQKRNDPPLAPANRGRGRGAGRGGHVQALPTERRIVLIFRGPDVPRLMGTSATPQFAYNVATHRASSCGTHRVVTNSRKTRFSACGTSCATSPGYPLQQQRSLLRRAANHRQQTLVCVS